MLLGDTAAECYPGSLRLDDPCGPRAGLARLSFLAAACPGCVAVGVDWLAWRGRGGKRPGPTQMANAGSFQEDGKARIGNVALISP